MTKSTRGNVKLKPPVVFVHPSPTKPAVLRLVDYAVSVGPLVQRFSNLFMFAHPTTKLSEKLLKESVINIDFNSVFLIYYM